MSSTKSDFTTLIVGAGIAGPVLAMALQKTTKHKIILVDAGPEECLPLGACINITANGLNALEFIDAQDIVLEKGGKHHSMNFRRGDLDKKLIGQEVEELFSRKFGYPPHGIVRQEYCRGLRALAKERGVDMRFGMRLKSIEEHDNKVTAHFVDGQSITVDLLIGCDGIHSPTRSYVVGKEIKPDYTGASMILGVAELTKEEEQAAGLTEPGLNMLIGRGSTIGIFKGGKEGLWGWFQGFRSPDPAAGEAPWGDDNSTEKAIQLASSKVLGWKMTAPDIVIKKSYRAVALGLYDRKPLSKWHKGRVVLVGDASAPTTPYGGQGSQMAVESAIILARLLGEGEPSDRLFARYAELRHPRTDWVTASGRRIIGSLFVSPAWEYVRDLVVWLFGGLLLRSGMMGHLAYNASTAPL